MLKNVQRAKQPITKNKLTTSIASGMQRINLKICGAWWYLGDVYLPFVIIGGAIICLGEPVVLAILCHQTDL